MCKTVSTILALVLFVGAGATAQMSQQRSKVTPITFATGLGLATEKDSASIACQDAAVDTTKWYPNADSSATQGTFVNFWTTAATGCVAKVEVQYGLYDPVAKSYKVFSPLATVSLVLDSLSTANAKNPSKSCLFYRTPKGSTVHRFIVTQGSGHAASTKYIRGQQVDPAY